MERLPLLQKNKLFYGTDLGKSKSLIFTPDITKAPSLANCIPTAFDTNGAVLDALGLASRQEYFVIF